MKFGTAFPVEWKTLSEQSGMLLSDILYGYAVEDLMVRLEKSSFHESMWIINEDALTEAAFGRKVKQSLSFYYKETGKKTLDSILVETILIERLKDIGKQLHTGRSRNDQVALDVRMYTKKAICDIKEEIKSLLTVLKKSAR